jgi:curved DNA-binding protein CbpA
MRTHYEVLGVDPDAPQETIEQAYRERVKETHPDRNDDPDATAEFKRVQEARAVLTDPEERARYDRVGHATDTGSDTASQDPTTAEPHSSASESRGDGTHGPGHRAGATQQDETGTDDTESSGAATSEGAGATAASGTSSHDRTDATSDEGSAGFGGSGGRDTATGPSSGASAAASESGPYAVRNGEYGTAYVPDAVRVPLTPRTITLVGTLCLLYPVFVLGSLFPPFPLVVNLVVGACTLGVVMYLLSIPEVGILVFGTWTLLGPLALVALGVPWLSLAGLLLVVTTWVPLGAAFLTRSVMRL